MPWWTHLVTYAPPLALVLLVITLAVLGSLYLLLTIVEKVRHLWNHEMTTLGSGQAHSDYMELRDYTRTSIHELRDSLNTVHLQAKDSAARLAERLARLEAKTDAQTDNLAKLLGFIEADMLRSRKAPSGGP